MVHYNIEKQKATKLCTHSLEGFHCHHKQTNTFLNILDRFPGLTGLHLLWGVEPLQDELIITIPSPPIAHDQIVASLLSSPNTDFLLFCLILSLFLSLLSLFSYQHGPLQLLLQSAPIALAILTKWGVCIMAMSSTVLQSGPIDFAILTKWGSVLWQCLLQCWPCKLVWPISRLQSRTLYRSSGSSGSCRLL